MHLGIDFCNNKKMTNFEPHHFYSLYLRSSITDFGPRLSWSAIYYSVTVIFSAFEKVPKT